MLKKIKNFINTIISKNFSTSKVEIKELSPSNDIFNLNITYDDINNGIAYSSTECIISNALKREGMQGIVYNHRIVLSDDTIYYPMVVSDHWKAFIGSKKFKPKKICYYKL